MGINPFQQSIISVTKISTIGCMTINHIGVDIYQNIEFLSILFIFTIGFPQAYVVNG